MSHRKSLSWNRSFQNYLCYYECDIFNEEQVMLNYEELYNGDINDQIEIFRKFEENYRKREQLKNIETELPCDPTGSAALL